MCLENSFNACILPKSECLVCIQIVTEADETEQQKENLQGHTGRPHFTQASPVIMFPLPPAHTRTGACELAPDTSCACASPVDIQRGTRSTQLPPATVPNFPQFSSSASTAGVTLARAVLGERTNFSTETVNACLNPWGLYFQETEALYVSFTRLQVPLRGFMQKRIRQSYSKQLGLDMALVKCLQLID